MKDSVSLFFVLSCLCLFIFSQSQDISFIRGPQNSPLKNPKVGAQPRDCAPLQPPAARNFTYDSKLLDRQMWNWNAGYCGECSFVMASLKYGAYFSQYDVRDIAVVAPDVPKQSGGYWYDISINDQLTNTKCRMTSSEFWGDGKTRHGKMDADSFDFIAWIKEMMRKDFAVTICVYMNHYLIYRDDDPGNIIIILISVG